MRAVLHGSGLFFLWFTRSRTLCLELGKEGAFSEVQSDGGSSLNLDTERAPGKECRNFPLGGPETPWTLGDPGKWVLQTFRNPGGPWQFTYHPMYLDIEVLSTRGKKELTHPAVHLCEVLSPAAHRWRLRKLPLVVQRSIHSCSKGLSWAGRPSIQLRPRCPVVFWLRTSIWKVACGLINHANEVELPQSSWRTEQRLFLSV